MLPLRAVSGIRSTAKTRNRSDHTVGPSETLCAIPIWNRVLDDTREFLRDPFDPYKLTDATRPLGLTVARGTAVMMVCPVDGTMEIANPFLQQEEEQQAVI